MTKIISSPDNFSQNTETTATTLAYSRVSKITISGVLMATIIVLPAFVHNQLLTGPIINAALLLSTLVLGTSATITLGLIPSLIALSQGLLPVAMAPAVPFIMVSNVIYVLTFAKIKNKSFVLGALVSAGTKTAFLIMASRLVLPKLLSPQIVSTAIFMLGLPQLATALLGGLLAYLLLGKIKHVV